MRSEARRWYKLIVSLELQCLVASAWTMVVIQLHSGLCSGCPQLGRVSRSEFRICEGHQCFLWRWWNSNWCLLDNFIRRNLFIKSSLARGDRHRRTLEQNKPGTNCYTDRERKEELESDAPSGSLPAISPGRRWLDSQREGGRGDTWLRDMEAKKRKWTPADDLEKAAQCPVCWRSIFNGICLHLIFVF